MKTLTHLMSGLIVAFGFSSNAFTKDPRSQLTTTGKIMEEHSVLRETASKKVEMVINTDMIERFRRYYDTTGVKNQKESQGKLITGYRDQRLARIFTPDPSVKTSDIIINKGMINRFRYCYDHVQLATWEELVLNMPASDWNIAGKLDHFFSPDSTINNVDLVINRKMIDCFKRNYARAQVIPWVGLLYNMPADNWGTCCMAYRRLSGNSSADSVSFISSFAFEIADVQQNVGVAMQHEDLTKAESRPKKITSGRITVTKDIVH